ncbi:hypothetical protein LguiA_025754 [Lonicera macranthoides]
MAALTKWSPPIILLLLILHATSSFSDPESDILLKFKDSISNNVALSNWNPSKPPCSDNNDRANWVGVLCQKGEVWGLKLEKMGLSGQPDLEPLKELSSLRSLSIMGNNFDGSFPNLKALSSLKTVYFTHNKFSGEIPDDAFVGMLSLKKIHLAYNRFSGHIPLSLAHLTRLMEVTLEHNEFEGEIPVFKQENMHLVNVSSNNLEGPIPASLSKMNKSSFSDNFGLCGEPLEPCSSNKISLTTVIIIAIVVAVAILAIIVAFIILCMRKKKTPTNAETPSTDASTHKSASSADLDNMDRGSMPNGHSPATNGNKRTDQPASRLTFLREDREKFDMPDLLKASAEILGGGMFGSTYKAALSVDSVMVVKRFRHMNNVGKEEYQEHMRRLGRLRHPNLLPLVAFYYRKEEKLLVSDYVSNASLAIHLHGSHSKGRLDWQTRLKIVKGVAKGLLYLYNELPSLSAPHGHLKSSNVLLNQSFEPLLTDYGLVPVVNQEHAHEIMVAYKSPEYKQNGRITRKTDIWSLGMLILEILTGKFPAHSLQQGKGSDIEDLGTWVQSVAQEELSLEVFDKEIRGNKNSEGEMMKLLKIGLSCCEPDVEKRWDIKEVVEKIEELREKDGDDDFYSSYASEGDLQSKRGLSEDFSIQVNG